MVKVITNTPVKTPGVDPEVVTTMIDDHDIENIGKAGKLHCDLEYQKIVFLFCLIQITSVRSHT